MDINFLPDKEKGGKYFRGQKEKGDLGREVKWSSPGKKEASPGLPKERGIKSYLPDFFNANFLRKKKEKARAVYPNSLADKNKLRKSRKELLRFISEQKKTASYPSAAGKAEEVSPVRNFSKAFSPARPASFGEAGEADQPLAENPDAGQQGVISNSVRNKFLSPIRSETSNGMSGTNKVKVSPAKKQRSEIRLKIAKLFDSVVAIFKKIGEKSKVNSGREEKEPEREKPSDKEWAGDHRQGHRGSEASGAGKEVAPEFIQVKDKKEEAGAETLETNLIKGEITVFFNWRKNVAALLVSMILAALAVGAVYGWLFWQGSQKEKEGQYFVDKFSELDKEIAGIEGEAKKVLVFKEKLSLVNSLLGQHVYWTNFFKFLEENTLADVYYSGFSGDTKGTYNLKASGKDFSVIQAQVERFLSSEYVLGASVDQAEISGDAGEIAFGLKLVIDPAVFTLVK